MEIRCINIRHAKCYLAKVNDFYIAIDAGWPGHINEYMEGLKGQGIKAEEVRFLFVTHFHPDHAGMVENIKGLGTSFVVFEHQVPYIRLMENMLAKDPSYLPINTETNLVVNIDEADAFFSENHIPAHAIKTTGHSDDSISIVTEDGCAFTGDLYSQELVMEGDVKSVHSWQALKKCGAKKIHPAHGNVYTIK